MSIYFGKLDLFFLGLFNLPENCAEKSETRRRLFDMSEAQLLFASPIRASNLLHGHSRRTEYRPQKFCLDFSLRPSVFLVMVNLAPWVEFWEVHMGIYGGSDGSEVRCWSDTGGERLARHGKRNSFGEISFYRYIFSHILDSFARERVIAPCASIRQA